MASVDYYATWQARFEANIYRHPKMSWENFQAKLTENDSWEKAMIWMEDTDGEPDLVVLESLDKPIVVDMSKASPSGRRSLCYDKEAREKRKKNAPESSVMEEAERFGVEVVDEDLYFRLQEVEPFDEKTESWLKTPDEFRKLGGALFGDRRYNRVFVFHNGADSYYASRGFRAYFVFD